MTTFLLPLGIKSKWDNNETRYMLRSLEENFQEEFKVIIYATENPGIKNLDYKIIEPYYPKIALKVNKGARYMETYFDTLNKMYQFVNTPNCPEEFVYIYDDILLIKEIGLGDIKNYPQAIYTETSFARNSHSRHGRTMNQAKILSNAKFNFETHLPLRYKRDKLKAMFIKFPFQEMVVPYSIATMYFNLYPEESDLPSLQIENNYKAGFEGFGNRLGVFQQNTIREIEIAVEGKTWVNYSDQGLFWLPIKYPLMRWIENKFPKKSIYEKR